MGFSKTPFVFKRCSLFKQVELTVQSELSKDALITILCCLLRVNAGSSSFILILYFPLCLPQQTIEIRSCPNSIKSQPFSSFFLCFRITWQSWSRSALRWRRWPTSQLQSWSWWHPAAKSRRTAAGRPRRWWWPKWMHSWTLWSTLTRRRSQRLVWKPFGRTCRWAFQFSFLNVDAIAVKQVQLIIRKLSRAMITTTGCQVSKWQPEKINQLIKHYKFTRRPD